MLDRLSAGKDLSAEVAEAVLWEMLNGDATEAQMAAVLVGLRMKKETSEELIGLQRAMIAAATPLDLPPETVDIVGTGGAPSRRQSALNVSTMAAFVAAATGATVCKHGSVRATSTSGSFDLLEALGIDTAISPAQLEAQVRKLGLGFAFARTFHPAMRYVAGVRNQLGIPTVFNVLGPLSHPGKVRQQVVGISDWRMAREVAEALIATGSLRTLIVHGHGNLDEISINGPSKILKLEQGRISEMTITPELVGLNSAQLKEVAGGDPPTNAKIARSIFAGEQGSHRDIVVINASAALIAAGVANNLREGVEMAAAAIDNGGAQAKLEAAVAGNMAGNGASNN